MDLKSNYGDLSKDELLLKRLTGFILANLSNDQLNVNDLSSEVGLSRSHLHRKLKKLTHKSISRFVRDIRLEEAHKLLEKDVGNTKEIAYKVGFNSPTYFNKCFHDYYSYPPGKVKKKGGLHSTGAPPADTFSKRRHSFRWLWVLTSIGIVIIVAAIALFYNRLAKRNIILDHPKTIAVMPFTNLSNNPEDSYYADGMAQAIFNHLVRVNDLVVRSQVSTEPYRDTPKTAKEIGEEVKVNYIIQGSFQKIIDRAIISIHLINTQNDEVIWSKEYDRDWLYIFDIQKDIAENVAHELYINISNQTMQAFEYTPTKNMEAYDFYLKGNEQYSSFLRDFDTEKIHSSIELFHKSIELDNNFPLGYVGLGRAYWMLAEFDPNANSELWERSKYYILRGLDIDPYNGLAHAELGIVQSNWDWDSAAAKSSFERATKLSPNNHYIYEQYFYHEWLTGNCEELSLILEKINLLNPIDSVEAFNLMLLECRREFELIAEIADEFWSENPDPLNSSVVFNNYLRTKQYDKAEKVIQYFQRDQKHTPSYYTLNALLKALTGNEIGALTMLDSLRQISNVELVTLTSIAGIYAAIGDSESMYKYLEEALEKREYQLHYIPYWVEFDPYINEPRFKHIIKSSWISSDRVN